MFKLYESLDTQDYKFSKESEDSVVDGIHILARVKGPAFFPDSVSGNNVFYSRQTWENALAQPEFQERKKNRLIFGSIGHEVELDDDGVRNGLVSHIVSDMYINEDGIGEAEYLVLNTGPGRTLNTLLRAGSKLRVSTRCDGEFLPTSSRTGVKEVDPDNFIIDRIDFVIEPGYKEALPKLIESLNKQTEKESEVSEVNTTTDKALSILESQLKTLSESNKIAESEKVSLRESLAKVQEELKAYQSLGTPQQIKESQEELDEFKEIADTPEELKTSLEETEEVVSQLTDALKEKDDDDGQVSESEAEELAQYKELAESPEEVKSLAESVEELVDTLKEYKDLGTPEEVKEALEQAVQIQDCLHKYENLGTPEEIEELAVETENMIQEAKKRSIRESAEEAGVDPDKVEELVEKGFEAEEAIEFIQDLTGDKQDDDSENNEQQDDDEENPESITEALSTRFLRKTRRNSIKESAKRPATLAGGMTLAQRLMATNSGK